MDTKYKIVLFCPYHFVHTILSNTILSVYHFVRTILSGHHQYVVVDGCCSSSLTVTCGVPQGFILGPLLFNLYINDLCSATYLSLVRFADNTNMFATGYYLTNRVDKSSKRMGVKINAEKTKTMAIGKQHEELQVRLGTGVLNR